MTAVRVAPGACGFVTRIIAHKEGRRALHIELESDCEAVQALDRRVKELGPLGMSEILSKGIGTNRVFVEGAKVLSHASCPVLSAIIKAAEVELGLNIPVPVSIEFEPVEEQRTTALRA